MAPQEPLSTVVLLHSLLFSFNKTANVALDKQLELHETQQTTKGSDDDKLESIVF